MVQNYLKDYNVEIGILYENGKILEIVEKTNKDDEIRFFKNDSKKSYYNLIHNEKINNNTDDIPVNFLYSLQALWLQKTPSP